MEWWILFFLLLACFACQLFSFASSISGDRFKRQSSGSGVPQQVGSSISGVRPPSSASLGSLLGNSLKNKPGQLAQNGVTQLNKAITGTGNAVNPLQLIPPLQFPNVG